MPKPTLHLFPLPIHEDQIAFANADYVAALVNADVIIAERLRTARRWISRLKISKAIDDYHWIEIPKDNPQEIGSEVASLLKEGKRIGIMSESGTPCIADPGHWIVAMAHKQNYQVVPILGPNSIFLALMASGLNGQNFAFRGYLPVKDTALISELRQVEQRISKDHQTQIYIETPYRNDRLLKTITNKMQGHHKLCLAINVTSDKESISTKTIGEWKKSLPTIGKEFCIFLMGE